MIRFKIYTDGGVRRDGFYFDNFEIKGISENLSVSEIEQISSSIYPNPVNNYINIRSKSEINRIEIYDILGKKILETEGKNKTGLRLPMLNSGVYIVKLFSKQGRSIHRILKK